MDNNFYKIFIDLLYFLEEFYKKKSSFENTQVMVQKYLKLLSDTRMPFEFGRGCGFKLIKDLELNPNNLTTLYEAYKSSERLQSTLPLKWKLYKFWIKYRN